MLNLSKEVQEAMWGDEALQKQLQEIEKAFIEGTPGAAWDAVQHCAYHDLLHPEWLNDELIKINDQLNRGDVGTLGEGFGIRLKSKATRRKNARRRHYRDEVLILLHKHRLAGGSLNAEEAFEAVALELGISRRDVEAIYKEHGMHITNLPRGNPDRINYAVCHTTIVVPRRRDRQIVRDSED